MRLDASMRTNLSEEFTDEVSAFYVGLIQNRASSGKVVPRDRRHEGQPTNEISSSYIGASREKCTRVREKSVAPSKPS